MQIYNKQHDLVVALTTACVRHSKKSTGKRALRVHEPHAPHKCLPIHQKVEPEKSFNIPGRKFSPFMTSEVE
jgi:hypothetical protein